MGHRGSSCKVSYNNNNKNAHIRRSIKPTDSWSEPLHMNALLFYDNPSCTYIEADLTEKYKNGTYQKGALAQDLPKRNVYAII